MSTIKMDNFGIISPIILSVIAFGIGYQTHSYFSSTPLLSSNSKSRSKSKSAVGEPSSPTLSSSASASDVESDSEDSSIALSSNLDQIKFSNREELKMVLVVNDELKMTKGKIAAQAGHATLACAFTLKEANPRLFKAWQNQGQPKIALRCANTEELETLAAQALSLNLCARTIRDAGRTQVAPGSKTIVGIGPGPARLINTVTGKLKLL